MAEIKFEDKSMRKNRILLIVLTNYKLSSMQNSFFFNIVFFLLENKPRKKDPKLQTNLEKFFGVEPEKLNNQKNPPHYINSPFSKLDSPIKNNQNFENLQDKYNVFQEYNKPYLEEKKIIKNPIVSNSKYVSALMNKERDKIRSHESKVQFFFEKNIEDYSKNLQRQQQEIKKNFMDQGYYF